jgi:hypothetical protein
VIGALANNIWSFAGDSDRDDVNLMTERIGPLYASILDLPFNRDLAAGTLARDRFIFYMLHPLSALSHVAM